MLIHLSKKDLGIKEGYYYFTTEEETNSFVNKISNPIYFDQGMIIKVKYGEMTHKRTVFVATMKYQDKEFIIHEYFDYEYSEDDAIYMFENGNYACDCNRSLLIRREYGDDSIPALDCGYEIEMLDYHFEYKD